MYIRFRTQDNSVVYCGVAKPIVEAREFIDLNGRCAIAECDNIPSEYDYLMVTNVQTKTDTWQEELTTFDEETQKETATVVEKSRTYLTCDLVAKFRPAPTQEQLEALKLRKYNARVTQLIRLKYDANAVEALLANYADDKEKYQKEFDAFAAYRKECKAQAKEELK